MNGEQTAAESMQGPRGRGRQRSQPRRTSLKTLEAASRWRRAAPSCAAVTSGVGEEGGVCACDAMVNAMTDMQAIVKAMQM